MHGGEKEAGGASPKDPHAGRATQRAHRLGKPADPGDIENPEPSPPVVRLPSQEFPLSTQVTPPGLPQGEPPRPHAPIRVEKPWGYELLWAHTEVYVGKLLVVRAGESLSLQFHEEKDETLHLVSGRLLFEAGPGLDAMAPVTLEEGMSVRILPGMLHRMEALTDCRILEASTPELDDVVRVRDRYGRAPEGSSGEA